MRKVYWKRCEYSFYAPNCSDFVYLLKKSVRMRLTTLARRTKIAPSKLLAFLHENDIEVDNGINTILSEKTIKKVLDGFNANISPIESTETSTTELVEDAAKSEDESKDSSVGQPTQLVEVPQSEDGKEIDEKEIEPITNLKTATVDDLEDGTLEDIDLIMAKKVKLEGIKVVGKIDLPPKVAKKPPSTDQRDLKEEKRKVEDSKKKVGPRSRKHGKKQPPPNRQSGKPLSYEEKLKREEQAKLRKRRAILKEEKKKKKAYYEKTVQSKLAAGPKKKKKQKTHDSEDVHREGTTESNPLSRFWAWLNGKYDRY